MPRAFSGSMSGAAAFDLAIIGHGMVGAAAARHAATTTGARVALIGPAEQPRTLWNDISTFGAHFDEGRITRKTDIDPVWARLAARSIDRYAEIEEESGIPFFSEVGHLTVSLLGSDTLAKRSAIARDLAVREIQELSAEGLSSRFPVLGRPCIRITTPLSATSDHRLTPPATVLALPIRVRGRLRAVRERPHQRTQARQGAAAPLPTQLVPTGDARGGGPARPPGTPLQPFEIIFAPRRPASPPQPCARRRKRPLRSRTAARSSTRRSRWWSAPRTHRQSSASTCRVAPWSRCGATSRGCHHHCI